MKIKKMLKDPWKISSLILGVVIVILLIVAFGGGSVGKIISENEASDTLVEYLNGLTGGGVEFISSEDLGDLYQVNVRYQGSELPVFITKDGEYFVQAAIPLDENIQNEPQNEPRETNNQRPSEADISNINYDDSYSKGNDDAKVIILEYSSFSCSFCNRVRSTLDRILSEYPNDVKIVYKHFDRGGTDSQTAQASECAGEQEKFWEMHDMIFDKGSNGDLSKYAEEIGINVELFNQCLDSGKYESKVALDTEEAKSFGMTGTPSFLINDKILVGAQPFESFKQVIDQELDG